jgi:hypothetical protein
VVRENHPVTNSKTIHLHAEYAYHVCSVTRRA